jgi:AcrR family transcriptional regulator
MLNRIKEISFELFKRRGFRSVTMDDIASEIGISKKTIYLHFKDKDELVSAIMMDELDKNKAECLRGQAAAKNAIEEVVFAMRTMQATMSDVSPSFLFDLKKYHHTSFRIFENFKNAFLFDIIQQNIERGVIEGVYRQDVNPEIVTQIRMETMLMVFSNSFFQSNKYSVVEIEKQAFELFLFGIVSEKGAKLLKKYKLQNTNTI